MVKLLENTLLFSITPRIPPFFIASLYIRICPKDQIFDLLLVDELLIVVLDAKYKGRPPLFILPVHFYHEGFDELLDNFHVVLLQEGEPHALAIKVFDFLLLDRANALELLNVLVDQSLKNMGHRV